MLEKTSQLKAGLERFLARSEAMYESGVVTDQEFVHVPVVGQEIVVGVQERGRSEERKPRAE